MIIVYRRFYLSGIFTKLGHFLLFKRKFSYDPATKPSKDRIYFVKSFLNSKNFQETRAAAQFPVRLIGQIRYSKYLPCCNVDKTKTSQGPQRTRKKLVSSIFEVQLSTEIIENCQGTIQDALTFSKLLLVMDNLFKDLPNFHTANSKFSRRQIFSLRFSK